VVQVETTAKLDRIIMRKLPLVIGLCRHRFPLGGRTFLLFLNLSVLGIVIFENLGLLDGVLDRFVVGFDVNI